jgi:hypothetical protein
LLRGFEYKLRKNKESFLKGLFAIVNKEQLMDLSIFGFASTDNKTEEYRNNCLRIPPTFLKNN